MAAQAISLCRVAAQPTPFWEHQPERLQIFVGENMEFEHWGLGLYIISTVKTCGGYKGGRDRGDLN